MAYLNLAAIRPCTEAEGPGKRFAIWCQGCLRRCPGCCNPHMQPMIRRNLVAVKDLFELIKKHIALDAIEGVSFIGGEPLLQAEGFAELALLCQEVDLSVLLFTGYKYENILESDDDNIRKLLSYTDLLVDGEFIENLLDNKRDWIGSTNQRVIFLTDRYKKGIEYLHGYRTTEMRISSKQISINGWPLLPNQ